MNMPWTQWFSAGLLFAALAPTVCGALPDPKTGGKDGGPLSVLVLVGAGGTNDFGLDATLAKRLADRGYLVQSVSDREPLSDAYLRSFNTVVVVGLEDFNGGGYYGVGGITMLNTAANVAKLQAYVQAGGGLVFVPVMAGGGSQVADTYNAALAPWKLRVGWETVRDEANVLAPKELNNYFWTRSITAHSATEGVKAVAYPGQLMRWDDAYPTNPLFLDDPAWTAIVRGEKSSLGVRNVNHQWAPADAGAAPVLAAVREAGQGRVGVVGIGGFYLITHTFGGGKDLQGKLTDHIGEATTGRIEGVAYAAGDGTTPSDWGVLFENLLRWTGEASTRVGFGGKPAPWVSQLARIEVPADSVPDFAAVRWEGKEPPPTWAHHLPSFRWWRGMPFYDEEPDPLISAPQQMNRVLIGAHSAYSDGRGSVAAWAKAARAAGFRALIFTERFDRLKREDWARFIEECKANSSADFACLQGMDIGDAYGNRYLILGNTNFPSGGMLTKDGKGLEMTARLSLGFSGHIAVMHRTGANPTLPKELMRHFQGVTVYTYAKDAKGDYGVADDAFGVYRWQLDNASNPIPIVVHELTSPDEVGTFGLVGFQQIVPSQNALDAIRYFRYGMDHFFENPQRYFITEGPIVDNFSIFNKDIGTCELNRDHWRAVVGATAGKPGAMISQAVLYERGQVVRRWTPGQPSFKNLIDGEHGYQRHFMLVVTDSNGARAISPHLRTVARGYYTRCGDRQNWFGAAGSYTGIWPSGTHGIRYIDPEFPAGAATEAFFAKEHPLASKMSLPFASNALTFTDFTVDCKYISPTQYGMDAWRIENVLPTTTYEARAHVGKWHDIPTPMYDPKVMPTFTMVDATLRSRLAVTPDRALFPVIQLAPGNATYVYRKDGQTVEGKLDGKPETLLDLPAGASIGDYFLLTPLTVSGRGQLGWRATPGKEVPVGSTWHTGYIYLPRAWRASLAGDPPPPWSLQLTQGTYQLLGTVNLTAADGGVAGTLKAGGDLAVLPLQVRGLNPNWPAALWTSDGTAYQAWSGLGKPVALPGVTTSGAPFLAHIGVSDGTGYAALPNTKDLSFYVGNTLQASNPALNLAYTLWTADAAGIEVNNPTDQPITARLTSPQAIPGKYRVDTTVTVPPGTSLRLRLPKP